MRRGQSNDVVVGLRGYGGAKLTGWFRVSVMGVSAKGGLGRHTRAISLPAGVHSRCSLTSGSNMVWMRPRRVVGLWSRSLLAVSRCMRRHRPRARGAKVGSVRQGRVLHKPPSRMYAMHTLARWGPWVNFGVASGWPASVARMMYVPRRVRTAEGFHHIKGTRQGGMRSASCGWLLSGRSAGGG